MRLPLGQVFAFLAAATARNGGGFSAPDYIEQDEIASRERRTEA